MFSNIKYAMVACENSDYKIVEARVSSKLIADYELTCYACYLIVQDGDPRKEVRAFGQTYFAIQTYL